MRCNFPRARFFAAVVLFVGIVGAYVVPIRDWRFWGDDYGLACEGHFMHSWRDLGTYFTSAGAVCKTQYSSNVVLEDTNYFGTHIYRPLVSILLGLESRLFTQYQLYLINILLLASVAAWFFYLFASISFLMALAGALFIACYASLADWVGFFCIQPYLLAPLCLMAICLLLKRSVDTGSYWYCLPAWVLFAVHLLTLEWFLVLPCWLAVATRGLRPWTRNHATLPVQAPLRGLRLVLPFFIIAGVYIAVKLMVYPVWDGTGAMPSIVALALRHPTMQLHNMMASMTNLFGLQWIGHGRRVAKFVVLMMIAITWLAVFVKSNQRLAMTVCAVGALLFLWPTMIHLAAARYVFLSTIFFVASCVVGTQHLVLGRYIFAGMLFIGTLGGLSYNVPYMQAISRKVVAVDTALHRLADELHGRSGLETVIFVGTPEEWFPVSGAAQALRMYTEYRAMPVCLCWRLSSVTGLWGGQLLPDELLRDNLITVSWCAGTRLRLRSADVRRIWLHPSAVEGERELSILGQRRILQSEMVDGVPRASCVEMVLAERWTQHGVIPVTLDFRERRLKLLSHSAGELADGCTS